MATMVGEFELYNSKAFNSEDHLAKAIFWKRPNTDVEVTLVRYENMGWEQEFVVMALADARKFYRKLQDLGFVTYEKLMAPK